MVYITTPSKIIGASSASEKVGQAVCFEEGRLALSRGAARSSGWIQTSAGGSNSLRQLAGAP
eukprot:366477-Chlamydomonas_euryale.AAC.7